ncbi:unnamed protein product [marine sediment metagenome]|uniref:Uncharacterized protein n=2 Tax=marine sediment metagenome TaxID=412755 RepID=X1K1W8_9ZZZZ
MVKEKICKKYNSVGECTEWTTLGDSQVITFKEEAKACNPKLLEEWKRLTKEGKILTKPEK